MLSTLALKRLAVRQLHDQSHFVASDCLLSELKRTEVNSSNLTLGAAHWRHAFDRISQSSDRSGCGRAARAAGAAGATGGPRDTSLGKTAGCAGGMDNSHWRRRRAFSRCQSQLTLLPIRTSDRGYTKHQCVRAKLRCCTLGHDQRTASSCSSGQVLSCFRRLSSALTVPRNGREPRPAYRPMLMESDATQVLWRLKALELT